MAGPAQLENDFLQTDDGVRLNLLLAVPAQEPRKRHPVVVLVPGWCMPARIWSETLQTLAPRYRAVALDPRGQGDSEVPVDGYHIDRRADDLACCVERFERVVLVGWSLGALEVLQYLHRHGERGIDGLVLVDSSVGEEPPPFPVPGFRESFQSDRIGAVERFVRAMFRSTRPEGEVAELVRSAMRMPLEASLSLFPSHLPRDHWRSIARKVKAPLLYAVTAQFAQQASNLAAARPGTLIETFMEAGHAVFADEPGRFNRMLSDFIDGSCRGV